MTLFAKKKPPEPAAADEQKISLALTPDEIDLLRECMKRTEDYYRGLLLLKQDWNAAQNEAAIAMIKVRLNMIDKLQEKTLYDGQCGGGRAAAAQPLDGLRQGCPVRRGVQRCADRPDKVPAGVRAALTRPARSFSG